MANKDFKLRRLNKKGMGIIKNDVYKPLTIGLNKSEFNKLMEKLDDILFDESLTKEYLINDQNIFLEKHNFLSKWNGQFKPGVNVYAFIKYLKQQIEKTGLNSNNKSIPVLSENGVYTWITFFYLYLQISENKGLYKLSSQSNRFILSSEDVDENIFWNAKSYRHLIFSLLNFLFIHENSKFPFSRTNSLSKIAWSDIMENTFARGGYVTKNPELVKLLDILYVDENKSDFDQSIVIPKQNYGKDTSDGFGGVLRRFIKGSGDIRSQLDMKWALREFTAEELKEMLPKEEFSESSFLKPREDLKEEYIGTVQGVFSGPGFDSENE